MSEQIEKIIIDPMRKYSKKEIMDLLQFNQKQLDLAIGEKLLMFSENCMYGVYFFQFLSINTNKLEKIKYLDF